MGQSPGAASTEALKVSIEIGAWCADFFKLSNCFRQALRFAIKTLIELNKKTECLCDENSGCYSAINMRQR